MPPPRDLSQHGWFTKHMDMCYHWFQDWQQQKQIKVYWEPGSENMADYHTKHHHPIYHRRICKKNMHDIPNQAHVNALINIKNLLCCQNQSSANNKQPPAKFSQGCINPPGILSQSDKDLRTTPTVTFSADKCFIDQSIINFSK